MCVWGGGGETRQITNINHVSTNVKGCGLLHRAAAITLSGWSVGGACL